VQDVVGMLDLAAARAGQVAAEQGLEHQHKWVALASFQLLLQDVRRNGPHLRDRYGHFPNLILKHKWGRTESPQSLSGRTKSHCT